MFAVYSVGCFKLPLLTIITSSVSNVMVPAIARYQKEGNKAEILKIWANAIRKINLFFFPILIYFFIFAYEFIIVLFTKNYAESVPIFRVGLLILFISGINTGAVLLAYGETRYIMKIGFARLPVTAAILYFSITAWGVMGAVAGDVITFYLFRLIMLAKVTKVFGRSFFSIIDWKIYFKIFLMATAAGFPVVLIKFFLPMPSILLLIISSLLYSIIYMLLCVKWGCIEKHELQNLKNFLTNKLGMLKKQSRIKASL